MKREDIVKGDFCAPYSENKMGWIFPGNVIEQSFLRANELAKSYAILIRKNSARG
jgi:hypothetical protein